MNLPRIFWFSSDCRKFLLIILAVLTFAGCASAPKQENEPVEDDSVQQRDKYEGFNRAVFNFNDTVDRWFLKPIAKGYDFLTPNPVQASVSNFFSNLGEVGNIINNGLQWKWSRAANDTGRLLVNSTFGMFGLFDLASEGGLEKTEGENFTQTLAVWGVPRGSYLVLPFFGPTTVRGGVSLPVDWATSPMQYLDRDSRIALNALNIVDNRAALLDAEELISGDRYSFVREVFFQRLEFLENDGEVVDDFGGGFEDDEYGF